jgi:hypothetical protein
VNVVNSWINRTRLSALVLVRDNPVFHVPAMVINFNVVYAVVTVSIKDAVMKLIPLILPPYVLMETQMETNKVHKVLRADL